MPERTYTDQQIGRMYRELWEERQPHLKRLKVRRALTDLILDGSDSGTGTYLPHPYDESELILKSMGGDPSEVLNNYASRLSANDPQVTVVPISLKAQGVGKRVDERAAEQERLLTSMWQLLKGGVGQYKVARSASWGGAGWYLTLPRDASWGLPDREYFDELQDDEIEQMKRSGKAVPTLRDGKVRHAEPYSSWMERRRTKSVERAISGSVLMTLQTFAPDQVLPKYDTDGTAGMSLKYAFAVSELPRTWIDPGTEMARSAAKLAGIDPSEIDNYGFTVEDGKLSGGITRGGEPGSQPGSPWTLAIFVTRDEVYYYVTATAGGASGKVVYWDRHGGGKVPLIPVPAMYGDSGKPGYEYRSLMDGVFALVPLLNQVETLLSNVATWDALGRFVIEADKLPPDEPTGEPVIVGSESMIGLQPGEISVIQGKVRQLEINADLMVKLLDYYSSRIDAFKPSPVTEGQAGASTPAWSVRMLLESSGELLEQAVNNHAEAVKEVMLLWVRWLRMLDEPIYVFGIPGKRGSDRAVRGLIEFDPGDLVESIVVEQSSQSAQQRVVLQQQGVELRRENIINSLQMYADYFLDPDPEAAEIRSIASEIEQVTWRGASETIAPGSVMWDAALALRGELSFDLLRISPAFAMATAEPMGVESALMAQLQTGNVAQAAGAVEPGQGMSTTQPALPQLPQTTGVAP